MNTICGGLLITLMHFLGEYVKSADRIFSIFPFMIKSQGIREMILQCILKFVNIFTNGKTSRLEQHQVLQRRFPTETLEHVMDWKLAVNNMKMMLREGEYIFITTFITTRSRSFPYPWISI